MPFIRRSQIPLEILKPYVDIQIERLRQSLLDPALSLDQRNKVRKQLDAIKKGVTDTREALILV